MGGTAQTKQIGSPNIALKRMFVAVGRTHLIRKRLLDDNNMLQNASQNASKCFGMLQNASANMAGEAKLVNYTY